ncbi:MAG: hypothetical protein LBU05_04140, partial [Bifidobacteriaceae bacterium]|nr:hypothetical protein [Bifidobacteriaceae bacterium]
MRYRRGHPLRAAALMAMAMVALLVGPANLVFAPPAQAATYNINLNLLGVGTSGIGYSVKSVGTSATGTDLKALVFNSASGGNTYSVTQKAPGTGHGVVSISVEVLSAKDAILMGGGPTITLSAVTVISPLPGVPAFSVTGKVPVALQLAGSNTLEYHGVSQGGADPDSDVSAAVFVEGGARLSITGSGKTPTLNVVSETTGIGAWNAPCGYIDVDSGTVTVDADGVAMGSYLGNNSGTSSLGGSVSIYGSAAVSATGRSGIAVDSDSQIYVADNAIVEAYARLRDGASGSLAESAGVALGGVPGSRNVAVELAGGTVTAAANLDVGSQGVGIGSGQGATAFTLDITGAVVTATGATGIRNKSTGILLMGGPGIGFLDNENDEFNTSSIMIYDGEVTATGGAGAPGVGAAVTDSYTMTDAGEVIITGGSLQATGGYGAPGIGSGVGALDAGANGVAVSIQEPKVAPGEEKIQATVEAYGGAGGAGIGGPAQLLGLPLEDRLYNNMSITGGLVTAIGGPSLGTGSYYSDAACGAGIGRGYSGNPNSTSYEGDVEVGATAHKVEA